MKERLSVLLYVREWILKRRGLMVTDWLCTVWTGHRGKTATLLFSTSELVSPNWFHQFPSPSWIVWIWILDWMDSRAPFYLCQQNQRRIVGPPRKRYNGRHRQRDEMVEWERSGGWTERIGIFMRNEFVGREKIQLLHTRRKCVCLYVSLSAQCVRVPIN